MNFELRKTLSINIKRLDMFPNHFFGTAEINRKDYKINIQGQSSFRTNLIKLPMEFKDEKALLHLSGINNSYFEDIVNKLKVLPVSYKLDFISHVNSYFVRIDE